MPRLSRHLLELVGVHKFLAVISSPTQPPPPVCATIGARMIAAGFVEAILTWGFALYHGAEGRDATPLFLSGARGMIFGSVFTRAGGCLSQDELDEASSLQMAAHPGETLIRDYWGDYIAVLRHGEKGRVHAVRAPTGARTLYVAEQDSISLVFSHAEDGARALGGVRPNLSYLRGFLRNTHFMTRATGLEVVEEIESGACVTFSEGERTRRSLWSPAQFSASPSLKIDQARTQIREAVELSAAAWATTGQRILHRLSGGLDSSILLGVMRRAAADALIVCANESAVEAPESDERDLARIAAAAFDAELVEIRISANDAQLQLMFDAPLSASPTFSAISYANPFIARLAEARDLNMVTNGEGGDQLFHRSPGAYAVADAIAQRAPARALEIALDAAHITGESAWDILGFGLTHAAIRRRFDVTSMALKTDDFVADRDAAALVSDHSWLDMANASLPGRARQISLMLDAITQASPIDVVAFAQCPLVLGAQPIVEACLKIPPYLFFQGGEDRALWRAAFGDVLPPQLMARRTKGATTRYFAALLEVNRNFLRERLLDGGLVKLGIVARSRIEEVLTRKVWTVEDKHHLLSAICCEAWLAQIDRVNRELARSGSLSSH